MPRTGYNGLRGAALDSARRERRRSEAKERRRAIARTLSCLEGHGSNYLKLWLVRYDSPEHVLLYLFDGEEGEREAAERLAVARREYGRLLHAAVYRECYGALADTQVVGVSPRQKTKRSLDVTLRLVAREEVA